MVVFGPQTGFPSVELLAELRRILVDNPRLAGLREAVKGLPEIWQKLTEVDPDVKSLPAAKYLSDLQRWMADGIFPYPLDTRPNLYALPITFLLQIAQYIRYVRQICGGEERPSILEGLKDGGIQGFCIGFLTAVVIACSKDEEGIAYLGAIGLRLAFCVGVYVDRDGCFAQPPNRTACIAVRCRDGKSGVEEASTVIESYPDVSTSSLTVDS